MLTAAFILFISISVCCTVCQYMCSRTYITIIVFIICEGVFSEKAFFGLGTGIRKSGWIPSSNSRWAIAGVLYPASATTICGFSLDILSYNALKVRLSCSLPGCIVYPRIQPCLSQAVSTAYAKTCLCSPFRNHPLSGSLMLHFCVFTSSGSSSDIESLSFPVPPDAGGWLSSFFFNGFFPCARRSFSISLFNSYSYQRACFVSPVSRILKQSLSG